MLDFHQLPIQLPESFEDFTRIARSFALCRPANGNESDLDSLIQRGCNLAHRCQRMTFVIGVLETADYRRGRADQPGELSLREARRRPQLVDLAGDRLVGSRLFEAFQPGGLPS